MNRREFLRGVGASLVALLFGKGKQPESALQIAEAAQKVVECDFDAAAQQILDSADKYNEVAGQVTFGAWVVFPGERECLDCLEALPPLRSYWEDLSVPVCEAMGTLAGPHAWIVESGEARAQLIERILRLPPLRECWVNVPPWVNVEELSG